MWETSASKTTTIASILWLDMMAISIDGQALLYFAIWLFIRIRKYIIIVATEGFHVFLLIFVLHQIKYFHTYFSDLKTQCRPNVIFFL